MQGEGDVGRMSMRQGLAAVLATGQTLARPFCLVLLAEVAVQVGQIEEGLRLVAETLAAFETSGRGDLLAEAYRLQGTLLLHQAVADTVHAEACFQQALAIARRQQARAWELRTAVSLSGLWQQQGKRAEAYELLAPTYGWFSEGFDTPGPPGGEGAAGRISVTQRQQKHPHVPILLHVFAPNLLNTKRCHAPIRLSSAYSMGA